MNGKWVREKGNKKTKKQHLPLFGLWKKIRKCLGDFQPDTQIFFPLKLVWKHKGLQHKNNQNNKLLIFIKKNQYNIYPKITTKLTRLMVGIPNSN